MKTPYREEVLRTLKPLLENNDKDQQLACVALGLAGEAGEVADLIKKKLFHGKPVSPHDLVKELGDIRWYLEAATLVLGLPMEFIEEMNVAKLRARFPNGFNHADAAAKMDEPRSGAI